MQHTKRLKVAKETEDMGQEAQGLVEEVMEALGDMDKDMVATDQEAVDMMPVQVAAMAVDTVVVVIQGAMVPAEVMHKICHMEEQVGDIAVMAIATNMSVVVMVTMVMDIAMIAVDINMLVMKKRRQWSRYFAVYK